MWTSSLKLWKYALLCKRQIQRIVDLRPGGSICACVADVNSLVCKFLHSDIEEFIHAARRDEIVHLPNKSVLYRLRKNGNADIGAAEFLARDLFAHSDYAMIFDNDLHRLISPRWVYDHRDRSIGPHSGVENFGIEDDISIEDHKTVTAQPIDCEPERIDSYPQPLHIS